MSEMEIKDIKNQLLDSNLIDSNLIPDAGTRLGVDICQGRLQVIDLVRGLDSVLTNFSHIIRLRGVELLSHVITSLDQNRLSQKEIEVLSEFACSRLIDHKSMELPTLRCLSYFIGCENKPPRFNKTIVEFLSTKIDVRKMDAKHRNQVYEIMRQIVAERCRESNSMDSDFIYSLVHIIEGESNPENLLLCFSLVSYVMKNFRDLDPFVDDLFEWLSSYYPIDYTPSEQTSVYGFNIKRSDLVQALYDCFYANELNSANLQTLLLEKLDSTLLSPKLESLECLIKCYSLFPLSSIKDYTTSLWTAIRMDCLKKVSLVDKELLDTSYRALAAMTNKLSEDDEIYFTFVSNLYEELAIAFRKPEMDLFEAATRLIFNAARPKLKGINYILSKILPLALRAISDNELRPIDGLAYIFEELNKDYSQSRLSSDLTELLEKLLIHIIEKVATNTNALRLLNAMIRFKVDVTMKDTIIARLLSELQNSSLDIEECLALICANYRRTDIIFDDSSTRECDLSSLMESVTFYTSGMVDFESKFSIYMRLLILLADDSELSVLKQLDVHRVNDFLAQIRNLANISCTERIVSQVGQLHAIIVNKIDSEQITPIMLSFFSSSYCQSLVPTQESEIEMSSRIYLPVIQWILKSLVLRNHHFSAPLINLLLNFITSDSIDLKLALMGSQVFKFVLMEDPRFVKERNYQIFALYRQKFYAQTNKEVMIRYRLQDDESKKCLLLCTIAVQISKISPSVYRKDYEWLLREHLMILGHRRERISNPDASKREEELISIVYDCLAALIKNDASGNLLGLSESFIDLNLIYAKNALTLGVRKSALTCLTEIATSLKSSELLHLRSTVVDRLKPCLSDKKRLVRQTATAARMKWIMIGQPVG